MIPPTRSRLSPKRSGHSPCPASIVEQQARQRTVSQHDHPLCHTCTRRKKRRIVTGVDVGHLRYPRSIFTGWEPPSPVSEETDVIKEYLGLRRDYNELSEHIIYDLEDFCVYRSASDAKRSHELISLQYFNVVNGPSKLYFDGILFYRGTRRYLKGVPFDLLSAEGYGDEDITDISGSLCIRSCSGAKHNVWYRLKQPDSVYKRYFDPFVWIANLAKHSIDFLLSRDNVGLADFKSSFADFLSTRGSKNRAIQDWQREFGSTDYRTAIAANFGYLWKEANGISRDNDAEICKHPVWKETDPEKPSAIPIQEICIKDTVVTPLVWEYFSHMYFASKLKVVSPRPKHQRKRGKRRKHLGLIHSNCLSTRAPMINLDPQARERVSVGNVVALMPDDKGRWKSDGEMWYAYVQGVTEHGKLDLIWLYQPRDTTMGSGHYPLRNELFMSDNCSCGEPPHYRRDVQAIVNVNFFCKDLAAAAAENTFGVRQTFRTEQSLGAYDFITLSSSHFQCRCRHAIGPWEEAKANHTTGDFVLLWQRSVADDETNRETLVPVEIVSFEAGESDHILFRRMVRVAVEQPAAPANELLSTNDIFASHASNVIRSCHVAEFSSRESVCWPYDKAGAADCYYVLRRLGRSSLQSTSRLEPTPFANGDRVPLVGLDLFCGGGSFARGLEETGAVDFRYAVDLAPHALHTYLANAAHPEGLHPFLGSVNDHLNHNLKCADGGCTEAAHVRQVDIIIAGSPCPGFSSMQPNKNSSESHKNASLVASVLAYVDQYMPKYLVLENVVGIGSTIQGHGPEQNVFSQIICCLVGMGYQVQQFLMDSCVYGDYQMRTRVFIVASVPSMQPLDRPPHTHDAYWHDERFRNRGIGRASNGLLFGRRHNDVAPLPFTSLQDTTRDLPNIGDGHPHSCIRFPDHRVSTIPTHDHYELFRMIPRSPCGMGVAQAAVISASVRMYTQKWMGHKHQMTRSSRSYSRLCLDGAIGTITTRPLPHDAFAGRLLHPEQHRQMSVMEVRRAQGFLDHEVIIGNPTRQWQIIGNSVDRNVARPIGIELRKSWLASDGPRFPPALRTDAAQQTREDAVSRKRQRDLVTSESKDVERRAPTPKRARALSKKQTQLDTIDLTAEEDGPTTPKVTPDYAQKQQKLHSERKGETLGRIQKWLESIEASSSDDAISINSTVASSVLADRSSVTTPPPRERSAVHRSSIADLADTKALLRSFIRR